jgi:hypothetical protein
VKELDSGIVSILAEVGNARSRRLINAPPNLSSCPSNSGAAHPNTLSGFTAIMTRLTVPVGTGDKVERVIGEAWPPADFSTRNSGGRRCTRHPVFEVPWTRASAGPPARSGPRAGAGPRAHLMTGLSALNTARRGIRVPTYQAS